MFQQILFTQWKSVRSGLIPIAIASFGLPLLAVQDLTLPRDLSAGDPMRALQAELIFETWQIWLPFFPILAAIIGVVFAINAWSGDHTAGHIYSLALPLPRWKYVLWKMGAGALLLLIPVTFLSAGSFVAVGSFHMAEGLHGYPLLFTQRFLMASLLAFGALFALASGTTRTAVLVMTVGLSVIFGGQLLTYYLSEMLPSFDWQLVDWLGRVMVEWPGPFEVYFGNWNLIDV
jgi:ABC-type transport system involved in multi-copper enzyme maturation permease subunit